MPVAMTDASTQGSRPDHTAVPRARHHQAHPQWQPSHDDTRHGTPVAAARKPPHPRKGGVRPGYLPLSHVQVTPDA